MPGKILLEGGPGAGQDPTASIETRDRSAKDITREGKRCDVTRGRTSVSVQIDFRSLTPDEILSSGLECVDKYRAASDGTRRGASLVQCSIEKAITVRPSQAYVTAGRNSQWGGRIVRDQSRA